MPSYRYTARDERGTAVTGTLAASNPEALADQLKRMGYLVTQAREVAAADATLESALERLRRVGYDDLVLLTVQLSKMIQVGIPLVTALDTLCQQTAHPRLRHAVRDVARNVESGASFSEAMGRHPGVFSRLLVNMVRAGEASGKLDEVLRRMATFTKRQAELRQQLRTALTYPAVLLAVGLGVIIFLLVGIIPKFMRIFLEAGVPLPLPTLVLYQASEFIRRSWLGLLGVAIAAPAVWRAFVRHPAGHRQWDRALLRVPVLGDLLRKAAVAQLSRTLETLLSSGISVLEALGIAEQACDNTVMADVCHTAQTSVRQGGALSEPLRISRQFPPMVIQMITVGEASGTMDHMLGEIADHYDELVQHGFKRLMALVEPAFLIVMGGFVALIMASILLPLFRMVNVIR